MTAHLNYLICSSPRSGSTLLAQVLVAMGVGNPGEFLNPSLINERELGGPDKFMKPTPQAYVEDLKQEHTTNGVFGIKVHYGDLVRWPKIHDNMPSLFPNAKYISITRRNVLRQAISAARAAQTMAWTSHLREQGQPRFNYFAILKHAVVSLREVEYWDAFYAAHSIRPLRIVYEDLADDYEATMKSVLTFLGISGNIPPPPLARQADSLTEDWVGRFNTYFKHKGVIWPCGPLSSEGVVRPFSAIADGLRASIDEGASYVPAEID